MVGLGVGPGEVGLGVGRSSEVVGLGVGLGVGTKAAGGDRDGKCEKEYGQSKDQASETTVHGRLAP